MRSNTIIEPEKFIRYKGGTILKTKNGWVTLVHGRQKNHDDIELAKAYIDSEFPG
jgi:hypothetical protein